MKVFLIGLPGSGKTTIGKSLADYLGVPFIDLDEVIVKEEGVSISTIFESKGESYFREAESKALRSAASKSDAFVMATGGGAPAHHDNMEFMNHQGITVFLNLPITILESRMTAVEAKARPLFQGEASIKDRLSQLLNDRIYYYRLAKVEVKEELDAIGLATLLKG